MIAGFAICLPLGAEPWQHLPPTPAMPRPRLQGVASINGVELHFVRIGNGMPVLLLHGGLANSDYWGGIAPALLAHHFEVLALDSRGHGRSTGSHGPFSYDLMADDAIAMLDHFKLKRVDLIGWSDGGIIGLDIAMRHPERLHRLAVYGANSDPSGTRLDFAASPVFSAYLARTRSEYMKLSPTPNDYDAFLACIETMWQHEPRFSARQLQKIYTPTLVFDGAHDEAIKREHSEYLAQTIPHAHLIILDDMSHFGMLQNPAEFARTVIDFLLAPDAGSHHNEARNPINASH